MRDKMTGLPSESTEGRGQLARTRNTAWRQKRNNKERGKKKGLSSLRSGVTVKLLLDKVRVIYR